MNEPLNIAWDRQYGHVDDYDEVRILTPVEQQQARRNHPTALPEKSTEDDGARLHTPDAHRASAVREIEARLTQAGLELVSARGWAAAIGYHPEVRDVISDAISAVIHAQDLLAIHEDLK